MPPTPRWTPSTTRAEGALRYSGFAVAQLGDLIVKRLNTIGIQRFSSVLSAHNA
jgi:hypothetical protein